VLVALGDAIEAGERADQIAWYGVAARVFACGGGEQSVVDGSALSEMPYSDRCASSNGRQLTAQRRR
jgi:hypothetical protein